jgi:hypothetical protein
MKKVYVIFQVIDNLRGIEFIISSRDEALAQMRVLRDEINSSRLFRSNGGCGYIS